MKKILCPAVLDGYAPRKDKTISLRFITQEKTSEEVSAIHATLDTYGFLYFKGGNEMSTEEIAELDALEADLFDNPKTQSQRIRNVLYRLWQQKPEGFDDFKGFYKFKTDRIIQHLKNQLEG